jgi:hypothetical protein
MEAEHQAYQTKRQGWYERPLVATGVGKGLHCSVPRDCTANPQRQRKTLTQSHRLKERSPSSNQLRSKCWRVRQASLIKPLSVGESHGQVVFGKVVPKASNDNTQPTVITPTESDGKQSYRVGKSTHPKNFPDESLDMLLRNVVFSEYCPLRRRPQFWFEHFFTGRFATTQFSVASMSYAAQPAKIPSNKRITSNRCCAAAVCALFSTRDWTAEPVQSVDCHGREESLGLWCSDNLPVSQVILPVTVFAKF